MGAAKTPSHFPVSPSANETGVELLWNRLTRRQCRLPNNTSRTLLRHYFNSRRAISSSTTLIALQ
jgi:hypothetical protein